MRRTGLGVRKSLAVILLSAALLAATSAWSRPLFAAGAPLSRPRLAYLLSLPEASAKLQRNLELSGPQTSALEAAVRRQLSRQSRLKRRSDSLLAAIPGDPDRRRFTLAARVEARRFNQEAAKIDQEAAAEIVEVLGDDQEEFYAWAEALWEQEVKEHGVRSAASGLGALKYKIFATQYIGFSDYEVALPDKYLKFANLGWREEIPAAFQDDYSGSDYTVNLERAGVLVEGVKVLDVGPWNQDDNYWNTPNAPIRPSRLFTDLPPGMPESQAAFFDDYNGGLDQFGREVLNPAGIDLTPAVADDLGLGYLQNAWIDVTYNWEAGRFRATRLSAPAYSTAVSKTQDFPVSWSGVDPDFVGGLAAYDVQYRPANDPNWTDWQPQTTKTQAKFSATPGRTYYFRVRARSTTAEIGSWTAPRRTIVPYEQNRLIRRRVGFSRTFTGPNSSYYLDKVRYSTTRGTYISYKFEGRSVALISAVGPRRSKAKIYIDGRYIKTIDNYATKTRARRLVFHHSWGQSGTHYLKVVNLATPGRARFDIDGVAVGR